MSDSRLDSVQAGEEYTALMDWTIDDISQTDASGNVPQVQLDFGAMGYAADADLSIASSTQYSVQLWVIDQRTGQPANITVAGASVAANGIWMKRLPAQTTMTYLQFLSPEQRGVYQCKAVAQMLHGENERVVTWWLRCD